MYAFIRIDDTAIYKMKHNTIVLLSSLLISLDAGASCIMGPLTSTHKTLHLVGSATIVMATAKLANDNIEAGILTAIAMGTARELYKTRCEYASIAYDLVGIYLGATLNKHISIVGNKIVWTTEF